MQFKWLKYPFIMINQYRHNLADYPVPHYPQEYIRKESQWYQTWKAIFPAEDISRYLGLDFATMIHLRISKLVLEKPIRYALHIETIMRQQPIDTIHLGKLPGDQMELIRNFIQVDQPICYLPEHPVRQKLGYSLRILRLSLVFFTGILYHVVYFLSHCFRKRNLTRDYSTLPWLYCSYSRTYLLSAIGDQPIMILPFSKISFTSHNDPNLIRPMDGYTFREFRHTITEMAVIFGQEKKALKKLHQQDYSLYFRPVDFYLYFQFPIALTYIRILQTVFWDRLPARLLFTNGSNEIVAALTSIQPRPFRIYHYQHGQMQTPLFYRSYSDGYLAWTEFEKNLIQKYSYDRRFLSGFYPKRFRSFTVHRSIIHSFPLRIAIFTNPIDEVFGQPAWNNFIGILHELIAEYQTLCRFTFNIHPAESLSRYQTCFPSLPVLKGQADKLLAESDLIITVYSTILVEALNYQKAVLVYRSFLDEDETLIEKIEDCRVFVDYFQLKGKMESIISEIKSTHAINLQPEQNLHRLYFGNLTAHDLSELKSRISIL